MKLISVAAVLTLIGSKNTLAADDPNSPSFLESGECASFDLVENFQVSQYLGRWYHEWGVPSKYVTAHDCAVDTVTMTGKKMKVVTKGFTTGGSRARTQAKLNYVTPKKSHKKPYMQLEASAIPAVPYIIVDTDYVSYSCIYSCYNIIALKAEFYWIYSRTPEIPLEAQEKCLSFFEAGGLDVTKMIKNKHAGCNHPPISNGSLVNGKSEERFTHTHNEEGLGGGNHNLEILSDDEDETEGEGSGDAHHWSSSNLDSRFSHSSGKTIDVSEESDSDSRNEPGMNPDQLSDDQRNSSSSVITDFVLLTILTMVHFFPANVA